MDNSVEFVIRSEDDEAILDELNRFFEPVAAVHTTKRQPLVAKAWQEVISVILVIVAEWVAVRYILDSLADRAGEWFNAIKSTWQKSGSTRPFNVIVRLGPADNAFEVQISSTVDQETLHRMWDYVGEAYQICELSRAQGAPLEKIRIVPDGTQEMLVVGYENNRSTYIVDLKNKALRPIDTASPSDDKQEASTQLWLIEQLVNRLTYLKVLRGQGLNGLESEINELEQRIVAKKAKIEMYSQEERQRQEPA